MTNPTSNFNWQMPTPTDLVTDLPADFEVFGQAVDTSMADLLGGTTGQILAKASNTNMDFAWITNDVGDITAVNVTSPITGGGSSGAVTIGINAATTSVVGAVQLSDSTSTTSSVLASTPTATKAAYDLADAAIAKSVVTTAGDIIYRNATVPARLGIGTANQVLAVNSGATAPEWVTPGGMTLINAGGTTLSGAGVTLSSIPSTFTNLLIVLENYYTASGDGNTYVRFNSDTGNNYNSNRIRNINATVQGQSFSAASSIQINTRTITANTTLQTAFSAVNVYLYTQTTPNKNVTYTSGATETTGAANLQVVTGMGTYSGTSAISSLTVYADSNFSGGTIYLYGVK